MRGLLKIGRMCLLLCFCLAASAKVGAAQCTSHPAHETTISVINTSSWPIIFSVDGVTRGVVPSVTVSDFNVSPGQHVLVAETSIDGETLSIARRVVVPAGSMCVWTVTNPTKDSRKPLPFVDPLTRLAVISLAVPTGM